MKKILIFFLIIFSQSFTKMNVPISISANPEIIVPGKNRVIFKMESHRYKITGLGNKGIKYSFEGDRSFSNGVDRIDIINIEMNNLNGIKNEKEIDTNGVVNFSIKMKIELENRISRGDYITGKLYLKVQSIKFGNVEYIPIEFRIKVLESLGIKVSDMDFGTHVIGEKITTKSGGAKPGEVIITGEPNSYVRIEHPKEVILTEESGGSLKAILTNDVNNRVQLFSNGKKRVRIDGEIEDTSKARPGNYKGTVIIKAWYD